MQWWAWIAGGAILLGAELALVDAQFYLVLLGASAICTGMVRLGVPDQPAWLQWLLFSVLAVVSMVGFRRRIYARLRVQLPVMRSGPAGGTLVVPQDLPPGGSCRLEFRGSSWTAVNAGSAALAAGSEAEVERVDGVTLMLRSRS
jgi:membrane protein implicated in regulation of membrane protease activity